MSDFERYVENLSPEATIDALVAVEQGGHERDFVFGAVEEFAAMYPADY